MNKIRFGEYKNIHFYDTNFTNTTSYIDEISGLSSKCITGSLIPLNKKSYNAQIEARRYLDDMSRRKFDTLDLVSRKFIFARPSLRDKFTFTFPDTSKETLSAKANNAKETLLAKSCRRSTKKYRTQQEKTDLW